MFEILTELVSRYQILGKLVTRSLQRMLPVLYFRFAEYENDVQSREMLVKPKFSPKNSNGILFKKQTKLLITIWISVCIVFAHSCWIIISVSLFTFRWFRMDNPLKLKSIKIEWHSNAIWNAQSWIGWMRSLCLHKKNCGFSHYVQ